jgi:GT2 family glycosyltransferase
MIAAKSVVFLIPSYQPTDLLPGLLEDLRRVNSAPIVVVNDGSGAGYALLFDRVRQLPGVTVLTNAVNLGKGSALKHGMNHILVHYYRRGHCRCRRSARGFRHRARYRSAAG